MMGEPSMSWLGLLQASGSVVNLIIAGWLVWLCRETARSQKEKYEARLERERSQKEKYEARIALQAEQIKMKNEQVIEERRARERLEQLMKEERRLWELQKKPAVLPGSQTEETPTLLPSISKEPLKSKP